MVKVQRQLKGFENGIPAFSVGLNNNKRIPRSKGILWEFPERKELPKECEYSKRVEKFPSEWSLTEHLWTDIGGEG